MASRLGNRSLERGLKTLEVLSREVHCSLHQLHERTSLPKSTLRRILATLKKHNFVRQGLTDGLYRPNVALPWAPDREYVAKAAVLIDAAMPLVAQLTKEVGWPSTVLIFHAGRMRMLDSTRALSPFDVDNPKKPDWEVNVFGSAAGLAYLSALENRQVSQLIELLKHDREWGHMRCHVDESSLLRELAVIRRNGYAARRQGYHSRPGSWRHNAIAVAITAKRGPIGAITLRFPRRYMPADKFAFKHLGELRSTAEAISQALRVPAAGPR